VRVSDILDLIAGFDDAGVRYLVVGGLAVIAHGYIRATVDIDLVLDPDVAQLERAVAVLDSLGYRPRVPVKLADFVSPEVRRRWRDDKDMLAFTVIKGSGSSQSEVDLFLESPFVFDEAYAAAMVQEHASGHLICFVDLRRLRDMKRAAGRPKDLLDLAELAKIHGDGPDQTS
jgi:hypothetical protein